MLSFRSYCFIFLNYRIQNTRVLLNWNALVNLNGQQKRRIIINVCRLVRWCRSLVVLWPNSLSVILIPPHGFHLNFVHIVNFLLRKSSPKLGKLTWSTAACPCMRQKEREKHALIERECAWRCTMGTFATLHTLHTSYAHGLFADLGRTEFRNSQFRNYAQRVQRLQ